MSGLQQKTLACIGCGNMGSAILEGAVRKGILDAGSIRLFDLNEASMERLASEHGMYRSSSVSDACTGADLILIAVKPQTIKSVLKEIAAASLIEGVVFVSVAAGTSIVTLREGLGAGGAIVRVMPNVPALVGAGISGIYSDDTDAAGVARELFQSIGAVVTLEKEEQIDVVTAVSGSGPGFLFHLAASVIETATQLGLSEDAARTLIAQTFSGSGALLLHSEKSATELCEMVTSPGGTTAAGLDALRQHGAQEAMSEAIRAATRRAKELS